MGAGRMADALLQSIGKLNNTAQSSSNIVLVKTLTTCLQMLKDRQCTNLQACQSVEEIKQQMIDLKQVVSGVCHNKRGVKIFFHNEERVGVKQLRAWADQCGDDSIIIVSLDGPTAFTRKEADTARLNVQFFTFQELCVNITRHELVPTHEQISKQQLPFDLSQSCAELPILATTDKVAQYYAFQPGDIIRITRTAGVQEPVYYYRIVRNIGAV